VQARVSKTLALHTTRITKKVKLCSAKNGGVMHAMLDRAAALGIFACKLEKGEK
jgi:hypothetical protein